MGCNVGPLSDQLEQFCTMSDQATAFNTWTLKNSPDAFVLPSEQFRMFQLTLDLYGIYAQRKALGVQVWRGQEWWMR